MAIRLLTQDEIASFAAMGQGCATDLLFDIEQGEPTTCPNRILYIVEMPASSIRRPLCKQHAHEFALIIGPDK